MSTTDSSPNDFTPRRSSSNRPETRPRRRTQARGTTRKAPAKQARPGRNFEDEPTNEGKGVIIAMYVFLALGILAIAALAFVAFTPTPVVPVAP